jgi:arsenate reductase
MKKLLFVCIENAGRSQMAEAFAKTAGFEAMSAGTIPAESVNPDVVNAMKEIDIDLSSKVPRLLDMNMLSWADVVITMGCSIESVCPVVLLEKMNVKKIAWSIEDPKGKDIKAIRRIRDEIKDKVYRLLKELK